MSSSFDGLLRSNITTVLAPYLSHGPFLPLDSGNEPLPPPMARAFRKWPRNGLGQDRSLPIRLLQVYQPKQGLDQGHDPDPNGWGWGVVDAG